MKMLPDISIVIPVFNESENISNLAHEIHTSLNGLNYEVIFVDDASTDNTKEKIKELKKDYQEIRGLSHNYNAGQSRAILSGVKMAKSVYIATLDGDGQNDPRDILKLYNQLTRASAPEGLALVGGQRMKRLDSNAKKIASVLGNKIRKRILKDQANDTGCGIKVFKRSVYLDLPFFDHMHRYIPALVLRSGFKIEFCAVNHRDRKFGRSKYTNLGRLIVSLGDLLGVMWLSKRHRRHGGLNEF